MTEKHVEIHEAFPYLRIRDAAAAIDFYRRAFGAREVFRLAEPSGRIAHAELMFGPTKVMLSGEYPEHGIQSPLAFGGTGSAIHLHVEDVDGLAKQAAAEGATVLMEPTDQFHGERVANLRDPFGHDWVLGEQIEKVTHEEIRRRFAAMISGGDAGVSS